MARCFFLFYCFELFHNFNLARKKGGVFVRLLEGHVTSAVIKI